MLALAVLAATLSLMPSAASGGDQAWLREDFTVTFASVGTLAGGPTYGWLRLEATIVSLDAATVEVGFRGESPSGSTHWIEVYHVRTRERIDGSGAAFLWVTAEEVARGEAWFGEELATYVQSTPLHHQFVHGNTYYHFDVESGLLARIDHLDAPATLVRTTAG